MSVVAVVLFAASRSSLGAAISSSFFFEVSLSSLLRGCSTPVRTRQRNTGFSELHIQGDLVHLVGESLSRIVCACFGKEVVGSWFACCVVCCGTVLKLGVVREGEVFSEGDGMGVI